MFGTATALTVFVVAAGWTGLSEAWNECRSESTTAGRALSVDIHGEESKSAI
jgi:hypothetical protein